MVAYLGQDAQRIHVKVSLLSDLACLNNLKGIRACLAHIAIVRSGYVQHESDANVLGPEFN